MVMVMVMMMTLSTGGFRGHHRRCKEEQCAFFVVRIDRRD
jgi:hypothetical protein